MMKYIGISIASQKTKKRKRSRATNTPSMPVSSTSMAITNSFVRSLTVISMMFDTPTTPARSVAMPTTQLTSHSPKKMLSNFLNILNALNDPTPHDERYARLTEYTALILELLKTAGPVTVAGRYCSVTNLKMTPPLPPELQPGVFVSGSSAAGLEAARQLGATAVQYPKPAAEYVHGTVGERESGVRVGIIAREGADEAWRVARARFPENRRGQLTHQLAMKVSDSAWHQQLSELGQAGYSEENPYWLFPFENYKTFCPYLVGSYQR